VEVHQAERLQLMVQVVSVVQVLEPRRQVLRSMVVLEHHLLVEPPQLLLHHVQSHQRRVHSFGVELVLAALQVLKRAAAVVVGTTAAVVDHAKAANKMAAVVVDLVTSIHLA
jgi:hypothetical protein